MRWLDSRLPKRFWDKVTRHKSGCWLWLGCVTEDGYGRLRYLGKATSVHRLVFGKVPAGLEVDHKCRVRNCVRPAHLRAVTHKENMANSLAGRHGFQRNKKHCPAGHRYTVANTYICKNGWRKCRRCNADKKNKARMKVEQ